MQNFFADAPIISRYTRADAIDDGDLIDVTQTAREAGFNYNVCVTRAVWADCVEWTEATAKRKPGAYQDEDGRLWDVLYMAARAAKRPSNRPDYREYQIYRTPVEGRGRTAKLVTLKMICGPADDASPCITIMLPNED